MIHPDAQNTELQLRPLYPRDVDALEQLKGSGIVITDPSAEILNDGTARFQHHSMALWWQRVSTLAIPNRPRWSGFVATWGDRVCGLIAVSPFNRTRSTWRVDRVAINPAVVPPSSEGPLDSIGSRLLRHCFETVWEARMWLAEVDIEQKSALAL